MKPQAVSYRWYQLTLQNEGGRIKEELRSGCGKGERIEEEKKEQELVEKEEGDEEETEEVVIVNLHEKKMHYEAALRMAACLDQQQQEGFMVYRPKFIREKTEDTMMLSALLDNELNFQFGSFSAPQAAPINMPQAPMESAAPIIPLYHQQQEQQQYMDDDWQAYQSD